MLFYYFNRDLKCENLLLDNQNNIKVSDFGFARNFIAGDVSKTFCGSAAYAGPEVLQGQPYHLPLHDVWAMGVILYIMVSMKTKRLFLLLNSFVESSVVLSFTSSELRCLNIACSIL